MDDPSNPSEQLIVLRRDYDRVRIERDEWRERAYAAETRVTELTIMLDRAVNVLRLKVTRPFAPAKGEQG